MMNCRPITDRRIDSRILFAVASGLHRLERVINRWRLVVWNAAGRAAVDAEAVGGLDVFAVRMPPRPTDDQFSPAARRMISVMEGKQP